MRPPMLGAHGHGHGGGTASAAKESKPRAAKVSISSGSLLRPALAQGKGLTRPALSLPGKDLSRADGDAVLSRAAPSRRREGRRTGFIQAQSREVVGEEENRDGARQKQTRKTSDTYFWGQKCEFQQDRSGKRGGVGA